LFKSHFKGRLKKFAKTADIVAAIEKSLKKLDNDPFATSLKTHRLKGSLHQYMACSCGYDCRIVFFIEQNAQTGEEEIFLIDIGTHDEVY